MRGVRFVFACACACIVSAATMPSAQAFVTPGWQRVAQQRSILGRWMLLDVRGLGGVEPPPNLVVEIGERTIRVFMDSDPKSPELEYRSSLDEDGMLVIDASDASGENLEVDVLLETSEAMTVYLRHGDDDTGIAAHFERVR